MLTSRPAFRTGRLERATTEIRMAVPLAAKTDPKEGPAPNCACGRLDEARAPEELVLIRFLELLATQPHSLVAQTTVPK